MILLHVLSMLRNMISSTWMAEKKTPCIAKNQKRLTRAINQSKIRQVRRSAVYQFGFLIPKDYKQALQLDEQNGYSKWYDAT